MDQRMTHSTQSSNLADILERVLDKGIVVAGDINISLVGVELLSIKVRLLIASVDKAMQIGINWWETDPSLSTKAQAMLAENHALEERITRLELALAARACYEHTSTLKLAAACSRGRGARRGARDHPARSGRH